MHILTSIHIYHITDTFCIWTRVLRTHIWLCPCKCLHLEPLLYILIYSSKGLTNFYHIIGTFIYEPVLCKLTYVCPCKCSNQDPQDHGLRQIFSIQQSASILPHMYVYSIYAYLYIYIRMHIFILLCECVWVKCTLGRSRTCCFSKMFNLTLSILS